MLLPPLLLPVMLAEQVAFAANRFDPCGIFRVVAELAAQARNTRINRAVQAIKANTPQLLQQIVARQDTSSVTREKPEEVEFSRRQIDDLVAQMSAARRLADVEISEGQFSRLAGCLVYTSSALSRPPRVLPAKAKTRKQARKSRSLLSLIHI